MKRLSTWLAVLTVAALAGGCVALIAAATPSIPEKPESAPPGRGPRRDRERPAAARPETARQPAKVPAAQPARARLEVAPAQAVDDYLMEFADGATRFASGHLGNRSLHVGLYASAMIRLVDSSGRCFQGTAESAIARMREHNGSSTFDLRIGVNEKEQMTGAFHGGPYDGLTIVFEEGR